MGKNKSPHIAKGCLCPVKGGSCRGVSAFWLPPRLMNSTQGDLCRRRRLEGVNTGVVCWSLVYRVTSAHPSANATLGSTPESYVCAFLQFSPSDLSSKSPPPLYSCLQSIAHTNGGNGKKKKLLFLPHESAADAFFTTRPYSRQFIFAPHFPLYICYHFVRQFRTLGNFTGKSVKYASPLRDIYVILYI